MRKGFFVHFFVNLGFFGSLSMQGFSSSGGTFETMTTTGFTQSCMRAVEKMVENGCSRAPLSILVHA